MKTVVTILGLLCFSLSALAYEPALFYRCHVTTTWDNKSKNVSIDSFQMLVPVFDSQYSDVQVYRGNGFVDEAILVMFDLEARINNSNQQSSTLLKATSLDKYKSQAEISNEGLNKTGNIAINSQLKDGTMAEVTSTCEKIDYQVAK